MSPIIRFGRDTIRAALDAIPESHPFDVTRVVLMRSEVLPSGSRYSEVASYTLGVAEGA